MKETSGAKRSSAVRLSGFSHMEDWSDLVSIPDRCLWDWSLPNSPVLSVSDDAPQTLAWCMDLGGGPGMWVPSVSHRQVGLKGQCGAGTFSDHSSGTETTSVAQVTWKAVAELPQTPVHTGIAGWCLSYRFIFPHVKFTFRYQYVGGRGSVQLVW